MMSNRVFRCIEGHTEGMPVRMVIQGVPELVGATMAERRLYFVEHYDDLRRALMLEPRGHAHMSGTMFYPPVSANADFSLLFIETGACLPMCGHATLGSVTFALEQGLVEPREPGVVVIDVPAGQVTARYRMAAGKVTSVRFNNVPAFLLHRDVEVEISGLGRLQLDIAYGGNFYPIVEAQKNFPGSEHFTPDELLILGREVQRKINQALHVVHPDHPEINGVRHCMWTGTPAASDSHGRGVVITGDILIDRSPCGTGTSARLAQRFARGLLDVGEVYRHESVIGTRFTGRIESTTRLVSGLKAVIPSIEGSAWITGSSEHHVDPNAPFATGFALQELTS